MNYETWSNTFTPIENVLNSNAPYGGTMYETYGSELDFVKATDPQKIWTLREEDGSLSITAGYGWVNRLGYFITANSWTNTNDRIILSEEVQCDCYKEDGYLDKFGGIQDGDPDCDKCEGYGRYENYLG
jgi:hypothetical protein